jgi:hypothetical protein
VTSSYRHENLLAMADLVHPVEGFALLVRLNYATECGILVALPLIVLF